VTDLDADLSAWCAREGDPMVGGLAMAVRALRDRVRGDWVPMLEAVAASRLLDEWSPSDAVLAMSSAAPLASSITERLSLAVSVVEPSVAASLLDEAVLAAGRPALPGGDDARRLVVVERLLLGVAARDDLVAVATGLDAETMSFLLAERALDADAVERVVAARASFDLAEVRHGG
jgi:hypothetical protein